jgi:hypothetical protein
MNRPPLILLPLLLLWTCTACPAQESDRPRPGARESKSNPPTKQTDPNSQNSKSNTEPPSEAGPESQTPKNEAVPANTQHKAEQKTSTDWWIVYLTGALVFVGICQIVAMAVQTFWMKQTVRVAKQSADAATATVKTMSDTAERQLRAYVFPVSAQSIPDGPGPGNFRVKVKIKNSGQTPAYESVSWCGVGVSTFPIPSDFPDESANSGSYSIAPGGDIELGGPLDPITPAQYLAISKATHAIYAFGVIRYVDAFQQKRFTNFRMFCAGEALSKGRFMFCKEGNEAN